MNAQVLEQQLREFSPLALLIRDERTNRLIELLAAQVQALRASASLGTEPPVLALQRSEINYCRDQWEAGVLEGEHRLYDLATLMAWRITGTRRVELVARVLVGPKEEEESVQSPRIVIEERITREELKRVTDYSMAQRIARHYRYRPRYEDPFGKLYARASFLEMRPLDMADDAVATRVMTRVKANEQIWNKVCDALFDIDSFVQRDKILNQRSKYIKDVFGVKVLTPRRSDSYRVDASLRAMRFGKNEIEGLGLDWEPSVDHLDLIEHKDYLALPLDQKKRTGWEAIKNVYRWGNQVFEVQIQTEANYFLEVLDLTDTSHRTFEMQRRRMRWELEERIPHYRDIRKVLKFLFRPDPMREIVPPPWLQIVD